MTESTGNLLVTATLKLPVIEPNGNCGVSIGMHTPVWICFWMISCFSVCLAQPGPEVYYPQRICELNQLLEKDPENDSVRLIRIELYYDENKISTQYDIDYLFRKLEAGTNNTPLSYRQLYILYGNAYDYSNPQLAIRYYRKAADLHTDEFIYNRLYNNYADLRNTDTALLYYDTLVKNYGLNLVNDDLSYRKIALLDDFNCFNPELVTFYNELSRKHLVAYLQEPTRDESYASGTMIENGFGYQFDLCSYYLRWKQPLAAKKVLLNLAPHIGKNSFGEPVQLNRFHRYYFLMGTILEQEGKPEEAICSYLDALDYPHYKDTLWSAGLLKKYPDNPQAWVLHAQTCYNQQRMDRWQSKDPDQRVLDLFRQARQAGSCNYKLFLAESAHDQFLQDYPKALEEAELAIRFAPNRSVTYENKLTILIHSYHHQFISEEQVEKEGILLRKQIGVLSKNVIYPVPEIGCESQ
jgi:hypothetical protein